MLYRFEGFELNEDLVELRLPNGRTGQLGQRAFELLCYLITQRDRVVARDELLQEVWHDTVVTDASLSTTIRQIRRVLGESASDQSVIRTVSRRGYRFVASVEALPSFEPRMEGTATPPMQDRSEGGCVSTVRRVELDRLRALLERVRAHRGGMAVLAGEPGSGKTHLSEVLAVEARAGGFRVARVRCDSFNGAPALWPFVQLLRQLAPVESTDPPIAEVAEQGGELSELMRRLGVCYRPEGRHAEPAAARFWLFDGVVRALDRIARERPLLIVLDDFHLADASSRELLRFAAQQLDSISFGVVVGQRDKGTEWIRMAPEVEFVALSPLDEGAARALVGETAGRPLAGAAISEIVASGRGNPLLLRELTRAAIDRLPPDSTELPADWMLRLPRTLRDVVAQRFGSVSSACQVALRMGACAGQEFSEARLRALLGVDGPAVRALLDEARIAGLVEPMERTASRYRFQHGLIRVAIYEGCSTHQRAEYHARIAEQIEREAGGKDAALGELAHHYRVANVHSKAARYARSAVVHAAALGAYDTAVEQLSWANRPVLTACIDAAGRIELLLASATSEAALGASEAELQQLYRQAFQLADELGSPELLSRAALGFAGARAYRGADVGEAYPQREEIRLLRQALLAQPAESVWSVLVQARLGVALTATRQVDEGLRLTRKAVECAEALADVRTLCDALLQRARALSGPGQIDARLATVEEACLLARRAGLARLGRDAFFERAAARLRGGLMDRAELAELAREPSDDRDPLQALRGACWGVVRMLMSGQLDVAEVLIGRVRELAPRASPNTLRRLVPLFEYQVARLRGRLHPVPTIGLNDTARYKPELWMGFAWLALLLGRSNVRRARALHEVLSRKLGALTQNQYWLPALAVSAWAVHVFRDVPRAERVHALLLPYAGENVVRADGLAFTAPVAHFLGCAAMAAGNFRRARSHFDDALERSERLGATVPQLITRKYMALLDIEQGKRGAGLQDVERVRVAFRRGGYLGLEQDLDADLSRMRTLGFL